MRTWARFSSVAIAVICTAGLAGCHHFDCDPATTRVLVAEELAPKRRAVAKPAVVSRVAEPRVVPAGAKLRSFCGQRHIRFQKGGLQESSAEKARNDVLCRQVYSG